MRRLHDAHFVLDELMLGGELQETSARGVVDCVHGALAGEVQLGRVISL